MKKFQIAFLILLLSFLSSCCWLGGSGKEIITTGEHISPTYTGCVELFPNDQLPPTLKDYWGDQMVFKVSENALKSPTLPHAVLNESIEPVGDPTSEYVWSLLTTFFPGLLAFEGVAALLIRRKRKHYVAAIKNLVPYDGVVDVKEAATDVARALGLAHSSPTTKEVFESEVANKGNPTPS